MTKEFVKSVFKWFSIFMAFMILLTGIIIVLTSRNAAEQGIGIGLTVGGLIGTVVKIKFRIPGMLADKDERTLNIYLFTKVISGSYFAVFSYLSFILTATGILHFGPDGQFKMLIVIAILVLTAQIVDKITYRFLCSRL